MPFQPAKTFKGVRHNPYVEVSASILSAGMPSMQMGLILYDEFSWGKFSLQTSPDLLLAIGAQGNTRLNGLTTTLWYTPASI